jgi:isoleucyl-tRNA synthetase
MRIGPDILKQNADLYRRFRNTLRYLLGALNGMSEAEHVAAAEMPELERWVLHRLHEIDATVREDLDKFDVSHLLTTLHNFCNSDLSAFYFDIRKDSLYCDRADSPRRRAARTVMEQVFKYLTVWLAPILCFTAEEAWLARFGEAADSVHLQTFPKVPGEWKNEALAKKWSAIRAVRRVVTGALEKSRNEKKIGTSLQAHPHVYLTKEHQNALTGTDLAEVSISSSVMLTVAAPPSDAFILPDMPDIGVIVGLAEGKKCDRCWQILPEVGAHADHPDLCNRCHDAVTNGRKAAA